MLEYNFVSDINYFHCIKIVELLKVSESATKNIFGGYSSKRMKVCAHDNNNNNNSNNNNNNNNNDTYTNATTTTTTTTNNNNIRVEPVLSGCPQGRLSDCLIPGDCLIQVARNTVQRI